MTKTFHTVSSKFEGNAMTSKVVYKVMVSGGTIKSATIIRDGNTEKKPNRLSKGKL